MLEALKKIDAFPKAFDDFRVKTNTGAIGKCMVFFLISAKLTKIFLVYQFQLCR